MNYYMEKALEQAKIAYTKEEVPIGCVIVKDNTIIASSYNRKEIDNIATYHAEILAINEACKKLNTWHLEDCTLYTTVEPCRISKVVYGTSNESFGHLSKLNNTKIEIINLQEKECSKILTNFFQKRRNN